MNNSRRIGKRIINVSNRLPVKIAAADNKITFQESEGGLATGLKSVIGDCDNIWIGWAGAVITPEMERVATTELQQQNLYPVFLTRDEINNFYEGFSNETLWPLFHYFPSYSVYNQEYWKSYVEVNQKYTDEILKVATVNDIIWVHDYQLMLVPEMLRKALPGVTIGYFQHIPFPSYDIFQSLPWKRELVSGLLGSDIVGFQTVNDKRHFIETAERVLQISAQDNTFTIDSRLSVVGAFPISIDYKKYSDLALHPSTVKGVQKIKKCVNSRIAISIDRLDYSKGILHRLKAFELFLEQHPECHEEITLVHLIVPSRDTVCSYKHLKEEMNKLISDINGKYSTLSWQPIRHFYRSFPPHMLSALYRSADMALVTPLRDGMNLVCKEFIASCAEMDSVLILSETAGAALELTDALLVNPNDTEAFANKIYEGLNMKSEERRHRIASMQEKIRKADIFSWMKEYINKLNEVKARQRMKICFPVTATVMEKIDLQYCYANKRLILLDYDGTLVPFQTLPHKAAPDEELIQLLYNLSADDRNKVVIISGRDNITLSKWLGHLPVDIVAEHGAWYRENGMHWFRAPGLHNEWKKDVYRKFTNYVLNTPGSFIEEKTYSLAWHYRTVEKNLGNERAKEILYHLKNMVDGKGLDILQGDKVIEVKCSAVNKGRAALRCINMDNFDFVMAIGDDASDEDMFKALPSEAITIKVGTGVSAATFYQHSHEDVRGLLQGIHGTTVRVSQAAEIQLAG
jgi:trehalose 6-phosphate synthase/phosphatase